MLPEIAKAAGYGIIENIYHCASEPVRWPDTLKSIAAFLDAESCAISDRSASWTQPALLHVHNIDAAFEADLRRNLPLNPLIAVASPFLTGEPYSAARYFGPSAFTSGHWWKQALQPRNIDDVMVQVMSKSASRCTLFVAMRRGGWPGFAESLAKLRLIGPHLSQSFRVTDRLNGVAQQQSLLSAAFDQLSVGVILVDQAGRIVHANHSAKQALDKAVAIRRAGEGLSARNPQAAKELRTALNMAGRTVPFASSRPVSDVFLPGEAGQDLIAWIHALGTGQGACFAVFLKQAENGSPVPERMFARRYDLTRSETRTLALLLQGLTLAECAHACAVSYNTMKTHLGNLFKKTGARRQAELIQMASALLPPGSQQEITACTGANGNRLAPRRTDPRPAPPAALQANG